MKQSWRSTNGRRSGVVHEFDVDDDFCVRFVKWEEGMAVRVMHEGREVLHAGNSSFEPTEEGARAAVRLVKLIWEEYA